MSRRAQRVRHMNKTIAKRVRQLHSQNEELGHEGILRLLEEEGIFVDEYELRTFLEGGHLNAGPTSEWSNSKDPLEFTQARLTKKGEGIG